MTQRTPKEHDQYFYSLTDKAKKTYSAPKVALLLAELLIDKHSTADRLELAKKLLAGGELECGMDTPYWVHTGDASNYDPNIWSLEVVEAVNQWTLLQKEWEEHRALLERAVAGDPEAAIEFCEGIHSGKIQWGSAHGGMA